MYLIENEKLVKCKNSALTHWSKHNFIFEKFSSVVFQKVTELKNEFKNILVISGDYDEIILKITKLKFQNLFYYSQYRSFLENISLKKEKVTKIFSSFETYPFNDNSFDLIICNFCFHNINKKMEYLKNLKKFLTKNGLFICNYFGENSLIELKNSLIFADEKIYGGSFLRFPKLIKLVDFSQMLMQAGFKEVVTEKINYEIIYNDVLSILKDVRGMGESGFHSFNEKKFNIGYYKKLNEIYKKKYSDINSKLKVSCEIISSSSWKAEV